MPDHLVAATVATPVMEFNDSIWWLVSRSTGIVAWTLLSLTVCWGLLVSTKAASKAAVPRSLLAYHRFLGGMAVTFTAIHMIALVADPHVYFGWFELFIPGQALWHPDRLVWGIVAFYLLVAVEVSSLLMHKLPRHVWRYIHRSTFVLYVFSTTHAMWSGPDDDNPWLQMATVTSLTVVAALTLLTILAHHRSHSTSGATARPSPGA